MSLRTYRKDGIEKSAPRLLCDDQVHCKTGSCLYDEMIERVCHILEQCIEDFEVRINENKGDSVKLHANLIKSLEKKLKDLEAKELSQWESQADPDPEKRMPHEIFKKLNAKLLKDKEEIKDALCKARESMPEPVNYEKQIVKFQNALSAMHDPEKSPQEKNSLLKACIERIDYKREKPQRVRRPEGEKRGTTLKVGGKWTQNQIELDVKLRVPPAK
jgi:hypothetical protein